MVGVEESESDVRAVLAAFGNGYRDRDLSQLDAFIELFDDGAEMIGIEATRRGSDEWFEGRAAIKEIVESDWRVWGDVEVNVASALVTVVDGVAWASIEATLGQPADSGEAISSYLQRMSDLLDDTGLDPAGRMMEATSFGLARLRERNLGPDHAWPLVITAVLTLGPAGWRFRNIHWSTPP